MKQIRMLTRGDYVIVDLDTGTVIDTNAVLVRLSDLDRDLVDLSDNETIDIAASNAILLYSEV